MFNYLPGKKNREFMEKKNRGNFVIFLPILPFFFLYVAEPFPTDLHFFFLFDCFSQQEWENVSNWLTSQGNINYRNGTVTQKWC